MPKNQDSFSEYWGNLTDHAPCCTTLKYAMLNTINHSWVDDSLQQKVCDRALAVSKTSKKSTVSDTIIITHSMGALLLGAQSLRKRSMGSDYLQSSCDGDTNMIVERLANVTGRCPVSAAIRSLAYEYEKFSSSKLNKAYKAAQTAYQTHVQAAMCSYKYTGLVSNYQWQVWLLGSVVPHKSHQNDGMVELHSCAGGFPESKFGNHYLDRFYATKLNHFDLAFKSGDALFDEAKMPVKWFECLL
ncbi:unnamed protein product [Phytophthora lilii]|uniref:Unnamed protein product n=1 Tax=Phytophthora lilii TaxID=2077276 RepID=A0A9W7CJS7_9STRA|nr:unnamed protein product [Phytophthora lilii]